MMGGADIMVDTLGNPVSVNAPGDMLACQGGGVYVCPDGTAQLIGTGFFVPQAPTDKGAATTWQTTTHSVTAGQMFTLIFAIWDSSDGTYDSTVLFDNFHWTFN
jgi:hypothetical protein